jgi:hypothetical protein
MKKNILFRVFFLKTFFIIEFFCTTQYKEKEQDISDTESIVSKSTATSDTSTKKSNKEERGHFDERLDILRKQYDEKQITLQSGKIKNNDLNGDNESFKSFKSQESFKTIPDKIQNSKQGTLSNAIKRFEEKQKQLSKSHIIKNNSLIQEGERLIKSQIEGKKIENILTPKELMKLRSISHKPQSFKKIDYEIKNKLQEEKNTIREEILQQKFDPVVKKYRSIIENDWFKEHLEHIIQTRRKALLHGKIEQYDDLIQTGLNTIREEIKKKYREEKNKQETSLNKIFEKLNIFENIDLLTSNGNNILELLENLKILKSKFKKYFIYKNNYFYFLEELIDNLDDNNFINDNYVQITQIKSFLKIILRLFLEYEKIDKENDLSIFFKKDRFSEEFKNILTYLIKIIECIKIKNFEVAKKYYLIILIYTKIIVFVKENKYQKEISLEQIDNILNKKIINQSTIEAIIQDAFTNIVFDINKKKIDENAKMKNEIKKKVGKIVDNYDLFSKNLNSDQSKISQLLK